MRVFMNPYDYQVMLECADSRRAHLAMRLMGECSFRVGTLPDLIYGRMRQSTHPDVDLTFWPILAKDTLDRDTEGKRREAWIPDDVVEEVEEYCKSNGIGEDDHVFRCEKRSLQRDIEKSRDHAVVAENNSDYGHVSSHDYRAYFATNMTLREGVDRDVVMELGGWDDVDTFQNDYLNAQFDDIIQHHLAKAGVIDAEDAPLTEYQRLAREIKDLKEAVDDLDLDITINDSRPEESEEAQSNSSLEQWND